VMGQGLDWVKDGKYAFRDPKVVAAVEQYRRSMRFAPPGINATVARQFFLDGKGTFLRDGPWVWAFVDKAPRPARDNFKVARLPFPHVTGGTSNSLHMAASLAPAKRELVWKLMALVTTPEWQEKYMLLTAAPAPRKGAITPATAARLPHLQLIADAAASAVSVFPTLPALQEGYNEYSTIFGRGMMRLISTPEPTEAVLAGLERELERAVPLR
jgi:multiple sugar transport system substrate-binding protein